MGAAGCHAGFRSLRICCTADPDRRTTGNTKTQREYQSFARMESQAMGSFAGAISERRLVVSFGERLSLFWPRASPQRTHTCTASNYFVFILPADVLDPLFFSMLYRSGAMVSVGLFLHC